MSRHVSATHARVHFGEILRAVQETGETIVVERDGRAAAVIVPVAEYQRAGLKVRSRNWQARIAALHGLWATELGARRLPDAAELVRQGREERDAQLGEVLRR